MTNMEKELKRTASDLQIQLKKTLDIVEVLIKRVGNLEQRVNNLEHEKLKFGIE